MRTKIITSICLATVAIACTPKQETVKPKMKIVTEAVYASGTLATEKEYKVVSAIDGYLTDMMVSEGDSIKAGELLFTVKNSTRSAQEQSAAAMLERTLPVVNELAPQIRELETQMLLVAEKLQDDSVQYTRYKNLHDHAAISLSTFEKYRLQYKTSQTELERLKNQLKRQRLSNSLQRQAALNELKMTRTDNGNGLLRSFTSGIVYEIFKQKGDMVDRNQPIALVGSGKMIAKLLVDEDDLGRIWIGQKVAIKMDAYPNKTFPAKITRIYPVLNKAEQSFRVDAEFTESLPMNIYGLNIEANILITENKAVVTIPRKAIMKGDSVLVQQTGKPRAVKIEKGIE
ncbi:MAG TPA: efflux RND transporter periplasmic adaptor subunit, partial [Chitinophagaceae bacterium]|nr:efflux RND transporter periplasmic adaptor subunit [Chitinophagaceae bacterium]